MTDRYSAGLGVRRCVGGAIGRWIDLGRGWQAVVLGVGIVVASELLV